MIIMIKKNSRIGNIADPTDHGVKTKENKNRNNYLDFARELKKKKAIKHAENVDTNCNWRSWNGLQRLRTIGGRAGIILTPGLLRFARILRRVMQTGGDCYHSVFSETPSAIAGVENSQGLIIIIIIRKH